MGKDPSSEANNTSSAPAPEVLKPHEDKVAPEPSQQAASKTDPKSRKRHHGTYRPSHKATFIGLAVVVGVLAINAGVIAFIMKGQESAKADNSQDEVVLSPGVLDKLGVSRNPVGNAGTELIVGPNSRFSGTVTVGSDVSIGGNLKLNSKFSANDASLAKLEAGDTALGQLNVNGDGTVSNLNTRNDLNVAGLTRLQGAVTVSQLLTVNNNVNVSGSLAVGGVLSANTLQINSLVTGGTLTVGGHIITRGSAPGVSAGPAIGSNGTVSISGNDASGTVAVNTGVGGGNGVVVNVSFRSPYDTMPHVVVTAVGPGVGSVYVNRSSSGFSIGVNGAIPPGGHAFDYIVMQ